MLRSTSVEFMADDLGGGSADRQMDVAPGGARGDFHEPQSIDRALAPVMATTKLRSFRTCIEGGDAEGERMEVNVGQAAAHAVGKGSAPWETRRRWQEGNCRRSGRCEPSLPHARQEMAEIGLINHTNRRPWDRDSSTATRPPDRQTRTISRSPRSVSLTLRRPNATATTSKVLPENGSLCVSASRNAT